jgi:flagellin-like protein
MRRIRAISPLIATIILIAITITAGLLIYNLFFSASSTASNVGQVEIMNAQLVVDSSGNYVLALTIKNTGTKPATQLQIYIGTATTPSATISQTLQPGQSYYWRTLNIKSVQLLLQHLRKLLRPGRTSCFLNIFLFLRFCLSFL